MTEAPAISASPPGTRVLYIDDDASLGRLVEKTLRRRDIDVTLADGADAGLAKLAEGGFDVVALDHYMPGKDGLATLAEIRRLAEPPPVVYVTGTDEGRVAVAALKAGAFDYVVKDVGGSFLELLVSAVEQARAAVDLQRQKAAAEREVIEAKDRAEMLLREVNHRVANSLALVSSLVHLQANALSDRAARDALRETQSRISAIAGVHRRLYNSDDIRQVEMDAYLTSLVEELSGAMADEGRWRLRLDVEPIAIGTDRAVSLGVIVTELVTNAFKYAYPAGEEGEVRVKLSRADAEQVTLVVEDDGVGWTGKGEVKGSGLGSKIINAMAATLRAPVRYDPDAAGTRVSLTFRG
ncbi:sensor histidine kinase [Sphingoaurantiacus capsulatus]|uniref:histidine kinase n=1 Tax=Sphingoaurantiacus capsulatus TaxID=1771310 RepID=A0ABV7XEA2_9SPHN